MIAQEHDYWGMITGARCACIFAAKDAALISERPDLSCWFRIVRPCDSGEADI